MDWKHLFDPVILQRGKQYFKNELVDIISSDATSVSALVEGSRGYFVEISWARKDFIEMECDCPHAASGYCCKHMAATLFAWEAEPQSSKASPVRPKPSTAEGRNRILPILKISENEIKLYSTLSNYRNSPYRTPFFGECKITLTPENYYLIEGYNNFPNRETMSLLLDQDQRINNFACSCDTFQSSDSQRLCNHLNSMIHYLNHMCFALDELPFNPDFPVSNFPPLLPIPKGESMAQKKERLKAQKLSFQVQRIENFCQNLMATENQYPLFSIHNHEERGIDIAAYMYYNNGEPFLNFQVVGDGSYKIKNISRFLNRIRTGEHHRYGQKLAFSHMLDAFTPTARRLIAVLMNSEAACSEKDSSVFLFDLDIDELFDVFSEYPDLVFDLELDEITQPFSFEILPYEQKYYTLHYPEQMAHFVLMKRYGYFFTESTLVRVHCHDIAALRSLSILVNHVRTGIVFGDSLLPYMTDLVQRANGETDPETTGLRYKLDIEKRNIRIQLEGNTGSSLSDSVKHTLLQAGATAKNNAYYFSGINQEILNQLTENLSNYGEVWVSDELKAYHRVHKAPTDVSVRQSGNLLSVDLSSTEYDLKEIVAILKSFRRKKEYHRLKTGETIKLDTDSWQDLSDFLDEQGIALSALEQKNAKLPLYQLHSLSCEQDISVTFEPNLEKKLDYFHDHGSRQFPFPPSLEGILKPYQKEGVQFLKLLEALDFNGILADDMGLGKTLQTLTLLSETKDKTSLIICPASLIYNWRDEIDKFFPDMNAAYTFGEKEDRLKIWRSAGAYSLIVTSYDYLLRDIEDMINIPFYYVVLDESQRIKNMQTKSAKAAKRLNSEHRLALSGTPIENNLAELWSVFDFLMPGYLYSYSRFRKKFELPIIRSQDQKAAKKLSDMVKPFVLRRLKKDVLSDLPEKYEITLAIEPTAEEKKVYQAQEASVKKEVTALLQESGGDVGIEILALLTRLRLLCCDRSLIEDGIHTPGSKVKACLSTIRELHERGQQVLVFSSFTKVLDLLSAELDKIGISHNILQGSTPKETRHQLVGDFQSGGFSVFLISLKAGGTGLNLTGAQAVIHFDPWWNKAAMNQATDRAYRIGQKQSVEVYSFLVAGTIEERIFELQNKKWNLAEQLIGGESKALTGMNREEVMKLFE